jgi:hypothetical protein
VRTTWLEDWPVLLELLPSYVPIFTTLPREAATTRQVLECYRLRWQAELTFKRLKSIA